MVPSQSCFKKMQNRHFPQCDAKKKASGHERCIFFCVLVRSPNFWIGRFRQRNITGPHLGVAKQ